MKLLVDENLAPRVSQALGDLFLVALVRIRAGDIKAFGADPEAAFLVVEA